MLSRQEGHQDPRYQTPAGPVESQWYLVQQECLPQMQSSDYRDILGKNGLILGSPANQCISFMVLSTLVRF